MAWLCFPPSSQLSTVVLQLVPNTSVPLRSTWRWAVVPAFPGHGVFSQAASQGSSLQLAAAPRAFFSPRSQLPKTDQGVPQASVPLTALQLDPLRGRIFFPSFCRSSPLLTCEVCPFFHASPPSLPKGCCSPSTPLYLGVSVPPPSPLPPLTGELFPLTPLLPGGDGVPPSLPSSPSNFRGNCFPLTPLLFQGVGIPPPPPPSLPGCGW